MVKITLYLLCLLWVGTSCNNCDEVTISNALPIQFWDVDDETFNEKEICSIDSVCFCLPFNCDDEIKLQFRDTAYSAYNLLIYDVGGNILSEVPFIQVSSGLWYLAFIPSEGSPGICERVQFKIASDYTFPYNEFPIGLDHWYNVNFAAPLGTAWIYSSQAAQIHLGPGTNRISKYLTVDWVTKVSIDYTIDLNFDLDSIGGAYAAELRVYFSNGTSRDLAFTYAFTEATPDGNYDIQAGFTGLHNYDRIEVFVTGGTMSGADEFTVRVNSVNIDSNDITILKKSDCIDLKESNECTTLINYSNSKIFTGIEYAEDSPTYDFNIRIPAIFFEEAFPDEHEEIDLSDSQSVRLMNKEKRQKKLDIGFMPFYMHQKLKLILAHDEITIDGDSWIRAEAYEIIDGNKRYPLRKASVLLTDKNYIVRNVL